jgi:hypothetical protein
MYELLPDATLAKNATPMTFAEAIAFIEKAKNDDWDFDIHQYKGKSIIACYEPDGYFIGYM